MARFQQTPHRLAMGDEASVQDEAELGLDRAMQWCAPGRRRYFRNRDRAER